ncbi:MAG: hypothetical protein IT373_14410 [Polyangiaceae bacterium]|nr:hypothetical protein [Polyangiaceae bacterium]
MARGVVLAAVLVVLLGAAPARAQGADVADTAEAPDPAEASGEDGAEAPSDLARPWLYNDDPTIPAPLHAVVHLANTYSGNDRSTSRAYASEDGGPGGKIALGAQVGLADMFAVDVAGVLGGFGAEVGGGVMTGARLAPFAGAEHGFRLAIASGYLLDLDRKSGVYGRVAASYDFGPARLATTLHGEHVFRGVADPLDVYLTAGVSAKLAPAFRLGAEYIAQDLEEAGADEDEEGEAGAAEGGVHQFVGLTGSVVLLDEALHIDFGPALALSYAVGVRPVGRLDVSYAF